MRSVLKIVLFALLFAVSKGGAAPVFSTAGGEGVTSDLFDISQGTRVIVSTPLHNGAGNADPRSLLGFSTTNGWVEPTHVIFADGPPAGALDSIQWQTPAPVNLASISLLLFQDSAASPSRGAASFRLFASADGMTFSQISGGTIPGGPGGNTNVPLLIQDSAFAVPATNLRAFRLEITRASNAGVRLVELDAEGTTVEQSGNFLDRIAFNAATNSVTGRAGAALDDEGPGLSSVFKVSSRVSGSDSVEDAFGNNNGPVEPEDFIFGDGGVADNGNLIMGDGGETVDFIEWHTSEPLTLSGYRLGLSGDGPSAERDTELVRFFVEGTQVDLFDNNGFDGDVTRIFPDGAVVGDDFRIEFTRTNSTGPRIFEIDAITGVLTPLNIGVVLNEVVSVNNDSLHDEDGDSSDWIEIFNGTSAPAALAGWGLSDQPGMPFKWIFPAVTIPPRGYLVVFASGKDRKGGATPLHTNFSLKSEGEPLTLTKPDGTQADVSPAVRLARDTSSGRFPSATGAWKFFAEPTPGRSNTPAAPYESLVFDAPGFSIPGGFYGNTLALALSTTEPGVTLRYTLDGSEPGEASAAVTGPLTIASRLGAPNGISMIQGTATVNQHTDGWKPPVGEVRKATVVRARGFRDGGLPGPITTHTYFVGADATRSDGLPTLAIATPPAGLFDYASGIYMLGSIFDQYVATHPGEALTGHTPANYTQRGGAWERAAHLEFFNADGSPGFAEPAVIDIQGQSSRSFRQKSFGIKARGEESPEDAIAFPIFAGLKKLGDGSPLTVFRHLRLRNFGNDWDGAIMRDDFAARLAAGLGVDLMSSRPTSIYLDGEYWGVLTLREQQDARYVQAHYGVDDDEVVILSGAGSLDEGQPGDEQAFIELRNYAETHNLAIQADYDYIRARLDTDSFLHYQLCEIFYANADWPQNNTRIWRRRLAQPDATLGRGKDGRWRWFLFDVDLGLGHMWSAGVTENTLAVAISPTGRSGFNNAWGTAFLRRLLTNPEFKRDFINTAADLLNSWFQPARATALLDAMKAELQPAMAEHHRRWQVNGASVATWQSRVQVVRDFAALRSANVRQHFISTFALGGSLPLTVNVSDPVRGSVRVNRLLVNSQLPGANALSPYPWSGTYFQNTPITLSAVPAPGYQFAGWSGVPGLPNNATISLALSAATSVTARFIPQPPTMLGILREAAQVRLSIRGTPGAPYTLEKSADLIGWSEALAFTIGTDGRAELVVPASANEGKQFFRAVSH
ncbi:MAG: hypothetical protein JWL90_2939 [Chthoniobacteraceae bacterium]|nr:hypothetical protein [Chthoniobacteraceae bacterium]